MRRLIRAGAEVNVKDASQQSAYLIATSEVGDDARLLELTLAHGADVDAKDSYNGTGLIRAAERGHARIVERLLAAGIDRDHVNRLGSTALLEAIVLGDGGSATCGRSAHSWRAAWTSTSRTATASARSPTPSAGASTGSRGSCAPPAPAR